MSRREVLELAILGQLDTAPMHGYELRKQLNARLGAFRTLSFGSLYPALRRLTAAGLITEASSDTLPHALAGRRSRIVYRLTEAGRARLAETLATAEPEAWEIGRASCRERGEIPGVVRSLKKKRMMMEASDVCVYITSMI